MPRRGPLSPEASELYDTLFDLYLEADEPAVRTLAEKCGPGVISHNTTHRVLNEPHQTKLHHLKAIVEQLSIRAHGDNSHQASDVQRFTKMWKAAKVAETRPHDGDGPHHGNAPQEDPITEGRSVHRTRRTQPDNDGGQPQDRDKLADVARQRDELQQERDTVVRKLAELRQERDAAAREHDELRDKLADALQQCNATAQERDQLQQKLTEAEQERDTAIQERDELQKELDTKRRRHWKMPTIPVGRY